MHMTKRIRLVFLLNNYKKEILSRFNMAENSPRLKRGTILSFFSIQSPKKQKSQSSSSSQPSHIESTCIDTLSSTGECFLVFLINQYMALITSLSLSV